MWHQYDIQIDFDNYFFNFPEPTDAGIIPPQFRKPHHVPSNSNTAANHIPVETNSAPEKKQPHQWSSNPVEEWAKEQVKPHIPSRIGNERY